MPKKITLAQDTTPSLMKVADINGDRLGSLAIRDEQRFLVDTNFQGALKG